MTCTKRLGWGMGAVITVAWATFGAVAQTIAVQSGEHENFTRLVLDIGLDRDWSLVGSDNTHRLTLTPDVDGYAIDQVFDLIPRSRLSTLSVDGGLVLSLACPCDVSASRYQGRYLILDIAASDSAEPSSSAPDIAPPEIVSTLPLVASQRLPDMTRVLTTDRVTPPTYLPPPPPPGQVAPDLAEAARIMSEQLARAAASGLLSAAPLRPMSDADPVQDPQINASEMGSVTAETAPATPTQSFPVRAETALDAALHQAFGPQPQRNLLVCSGEAIAIRDWSDGAGVGQGLGMLRAALYDERDRLDRDAALALARHYLFYGFGAEAAFWLAQIDAPPDDLRVIAALVDQMVGPHFPAEPDPLTCSDEELLWRYLDDSLGAAPVTADQAGRLQRATAALPSVLRDQIAPRVARALHANGHEEEARNLRDMLARGARLPEAALLSLDFDLEVLGGDGADPETRQALATALRDDGGDPVTIMAHALAFDRENGIPIPDIRLGAAEALLREYGLGPETITLWLEVTLAHAAAGALDQMLAFLSGASQLSEIPRNNALTAIFADRLEAGDTSALFLLARVQGPTWRAEGSLAGRTRVGVIAHLRAAGFFEAAEILLADQPTLILPTRPGPLAPGPSDALRVAWQGGDWAVLAQAATGPHQAIAQRMMAPSFAAPDPLMPIDLPDIAARVSDSRDLRADIGALLAMGGPMLGAVPE